MFGCERIIVFDGEPEKDQLTFVCCCWPDDLISAPSCLPYHLPLNNKWPSQPCVEHAR